MLMKTLTPEMQSAAIRNVLLSRKSEEARQRKDMLRSRHVAVRELVR